MIVAYCFCPQDEALALKNAEWINELGGCKGHEAFMLYDRRCQLAVPIQRELTKAFDNVIVMKAGAEIDGWPQGANYFFRMVSGYLQSTNRPYFFWLEPDAIPLRENWLDVLEHHYLENKRPFMGDRVQVENIPLHMSGVGIYPNPLHQYAGEAYRAHDVAFDMAGKDQIIHQAHFTKLIEHAWKHPSFTKLEELDTQIRPEALIFHSSKDGSLIDVLRRKAAPEAERTATTVPTTAHEVSLEEIGDRGAQPSCDIFIRTYPADYPWLKHCLQSINKYATGFRKIWIISPEESPFDMTSMGYHWKKVNEETNDGYLAQQIHKLYADVITDYQADYILHIDSDTLFTCHVTPQTFLRGGKSVIWPYTPYAAIKTPWQPIMEKFMGFTPENEFMRRFPIMVPRWLYAKLREFCHNKHGIIISDYIRNQPFREFSEFNALGCFAWKAYHDQFDWVNTLDNNDGAPSVARQFFSWGGITDQVKEEIASILSGGEVSGVRAEGPSSEVSETRSPPTQSPSGTESIPVTEPQPNPPDMLPTSVPELSLRDHIKILGEYSARNRDSRKYVRKLLRQEGLIPRAVVKK